MEDGCWDLHAIEDISEYIPRWWGELPSRLCAQVDKSLMAFVGSLLGVDVGCDA